MSKVTQCKTNNSGKGSRKRKRDLQPRVDLSENASSPPCQQLMRWKRHDDESSQWMVEMGMEMLGDGSTDSPSQSAAPRAVVSAISKKRVVVSKTAFPKSPPATTDDNSKLPVVGADFVLYRRARNLDPLGEDNVSKISDEMVLQIFKWLPKAVLVRCAQVCRRWKRLALDETLWKRIDLGGKYVKAGVVGQLIKRGATILRMSKTNVEMPIFMDFTGISSDRFSPLQFLDLSMAGLTVKGLNELLSVCSQLKKLSLEHCNVNDETCRQLSENPSLDCLNLCMCEGLTKTGIGFILHGCTKLKIVNISWTHLSTTALSYLCSQLPPDLEKLNIAGFRSELNDDAVMILAERCPHLKELDMSDSALLTAKSIQAIIENFDSLEHLSLSRCYAIPASQYLSLEMCFSLRNLDIYGLLSDASLQTLQVSLSNLEVNTNPFSSMARPTVGVRRTSIWGLRVRD